LFSSASLITYQRSTSGIDGQSWLSSDRLWLLGPKASHLEALMSEEIRRGLESLDHPANGNAAFAIESYNRSLRTASAILQRALRASSISGRVVHALAIVRREQSIALGIRDDSGYESLLKLALTRRPFDAEFHLQVAGTYLRLGRPVDALQIAKHAIQANPSVATPAVALLSSYGRSHDEILTALGPRAEVLVAMKDSFLAAGDAEGYLTAVERELPQATTLVLQAYGDVCSRQGSWPRLRQHLESIGPFASDFDEAERLGWIGRSHFADGDFEEATSLARRALSFRAEDPSFLELLGDCLAALGRNDEALEALNSALSSAVRVRPVNSQRGRLYRKMGSIFEREGAGDRAYDAYQRALSLNPDDELAQARLRQLTVGAREKPRKAP
jgi:tetratricopeptide (TPR) repeat protein